MWEGWDKYVDRENCKRYELLVGSKIEVLLVVYLDKVAPESSAWKALVIAFNPGAGEYIDYEVVFPNFVEAETKAWEAAQEAVIIRRDL